MPSYAVFWSDRAYASLRQIHLFLNENSPAGAKKVVRAMLDHSKTLEKLPRRNPIEPNLKFAPDEYRFLVKWNYKIIYTILEKEKKVMVVLVFDTRRNPAFLNIL